MSTATPQPVAAPVAQRQILIVSHSTLFYWWPVWAVALLMYMITMVSGDKMASIPHGSITEKSEKVAVTNAKGDTIYPNRDVIVAPENKALKTLHISSNIHLGVIFCMVLLLVIFITNVPLRGLWSVIVIIFGIAVLIILALMNWLEMILEHLAILDVRINAAGYFLIFLVLFTLWVLIFVLFDRQVYMIFTPGQLKVKLAIGDAETAYDTTGMTIEKQRSDLFRHWILGLGSGDLIVRTAGAQGHQFDMANVLFLGRKVREIEEMLRSRQVVSGPNV